MHGREKQRGKWDKREKQRPEQEAQGGVFVTSCDTEGSDKWGKWGKKEGQ